MLSEQDNAIKENPSTSERATSHQERELQEWAKALRIPAARLKEAVAAVGITPRRIREYLRRNQ